MLSREGGYEILRMAMNSSNPTQNKTSKKDLLFFSLVWLIGLLNYLTTFRVLDGIGKLLLFCRCVWLARFYSAITSRRKAWPNPTPWYPAGSNQANVHHFLLLKIWVHWDSLIWKIIWFPIGCSLLAFFISGLFFSAWYFAETLDLKYNLFWLLDVSFWRFQFPVTSEG